MSVAEPLSAPIRVGPESNGMSMTPEEFDAISEWNESYRYELIRGVLIVSPPAGAGERGPNDLLGHLIWYYQQNHANGHSVDDTLPEQEIRTKENRRRADRVIWIGFGRPPRPAKDVPTVAIEFVAQSSRDRRRDYKEKRLEYARIGIKEYWVIDRFDRMMTVFRGSRSVTVVEEHKTYRTKLLPGFELPLQPIFESADRYAEED
jgi:Uma2 family endonuclease